MRGFTAIRVISLDTEASSVRRKLFEQMSQGAEVSWEYFPAFAGPAPPVTYDDEKAKQNVGKSLLASEIGCYTSHFKLWEWLANSEFEQAIIFEDDTIIDWAVIGKLVESNFNAMGIDILRLYSMQIPKLKTVKEFFLSGRYHLSAVIGDVWGMQGYLISRAAAARLVARYSRIEAPIDWVLTRYWEHYLVNFILYPLPVLERDTPSTIGLRDHRPNPRGLFGRNGKFRRFLYKVNLRLRREYFDLRFFAKMINLTKIQLDSANKD